MNNTNFGVNVANEVLDWKRGANVCLEIWCRLHPVVREKKRETKHRLKKRINYKIFGGVIRASEFDERRKLDGLDCKSCDTETRKT